jgi:transposase
MTILKQLFKKLKFNTDEELAKECEKTGYLEREVIAYKKRVEELEYLFLQSQEEIKKLVEELKVSREENRLLTEELKISQEEHRIAKEKIEELKGTIKKLQIDRYGQSSEHTRIIEEIVTKGANINDSQNNESQNNESESKESESMDSNEFEKAVQDIKNDRDEVGERRKRGAQKGHKGSGRKKTGNIPEKICEWKIPEEDCRCPLCGKAYRLVKKLMRQSSEIELIIELLKKINFQEVYEKECNCDSNVPELIVAKKPENIIYKSVYTTNTWVKLLSMKYLSGLPVNRFNELINNQEYKFNPSTVLGGFEKLLEVMMPLYNSILKYNRNESHWHADETRWCRMVDDESKVRKLHWMWVFVASKSVVYVLDPTRSNKVPEEHFKDTKAGILNVDRLPSYNIVGDKIILAYCWYHLRRDIINVGKKYNNLMKWSLTWLLKIRDIERINKKRVENYSKKLSYNEIQNELVCKLDSFFKDAENSIKNDDLNKEQLKVLKSLIKKRSGYSVFIEYPWVPLHNNVAERQFRHISYARNNYGGSKSHWGGDLAAVSWTIFKTAQLNGLNPEDYLFTYFQYYISTKGFSSGIPEKILPWNFKQDDVSNLLNSG